MILSEFRSHLRDLTDLHFVLPDGTRVPSHFHITEAGLVIKNFIDCGGTVREDKHIHFQMWWSLDTDHRLAPDRLERIISIFESRFGNEDLPVEMEYDSGTVGRYGIRFSNGVFYLIPVHADCLASDKCGIPQEKTKLALADLGAKATASCTPGGKCC